MGLTKIFMFFYTRPAFSKMANNIGRKSRIGFLLFLYREKFCPEISKQSRELARSELFLPIWWLFERPLDSKLEIVYHSRPAQQAQKLRFV